MSHHNTPLITVFLLILLGIIAYFTGAFNAHAQDINRERASAVIERRLKRLERLDQDMATVVPDFKRELDMVFQKYTEKFRVATVGLKDMIADTKSDLCNMGASNYCLLPEPVVEEDVSNGHTKKVTFNVTSTAYTSRKIENDETPCDGAFIVEGKNVCQLYEEGYNPIAVSQDLTPYPLNAGDKVTLKSSSPREECKMQEGKTFTVADHMNGRYESKVDIFVKCNGESKDWDYCMRSVATARAYGICTYVLTKE